MWVRLILENSTVCLISRRISLFCPVGIDLCGWCRGFFDNDSDNMSVSFFVRGCGSLFLACVFVACVGVLFSMESLILAQDERWRRA